MQKKLDKSLQAQIFAETKQGVLANAFAGTAQVVDPIFLKHLENDPERHLPVLANVNRAGQWARQKLFPKKPA
jgi:hypothetical protein